jgi:hypothetical protein
MIVTTRPFGSTTRPALPLPPEWNALRESVSRLPTGVGGELAKAVEIALEHAMFREKVIALAREALEHSRLETALLRFDLDATRREREQLARELELRS